MHFNNDYLDYKIKWTCVKKIFYIVCQNGKIYYVTPTMNGDKLESIAK